MYWQYTTLPSQPNEQNVSYLNRISQCWGIMVDYTFEHTTVKKQDRLWQATCIVTSQNHKLLRGVAIGSGKKVAKEAAAKDVIDAMKTGQSNNRGTESEETVHYSKKILERRRAADSHAAILLQMQELTANDWAISIDIEMWEHAPNKVMLEVGIACVTGDKWKGPDVRQRLSVHHLLVAENLHLHNGDFVADNRDKFHFGKSLVMSKATVCEEVQRVLNQAQLAGGRVFLVGHSIGGDLKWLQNVLGVQVVAITECDIAEAWKSHNGKDNKQNLEEMCEEYGLMMDAAFHNGANDAAYQLELCQVMAFAQ